MKNKRAKFLTKTFGLFGKSKYLKQTCTCNNKQEMTNSKQTWTECKRCFKKSNIKVKDKK